MKGKREKGVKKWKQIKRDEMTFEKYGNEKDIETELIIKYPKRCRNTAGLM